MSARGVKRLWEDDWEDEDLQLVPTSTLASGLDGHQQKDSNTCSRFKEEDALNEKNSSPQDSKRAEVNTSHLRTALALRHNNGGSGLVDMPDARLYTLHTVLDVLPFNHLPLQPTISRSPEECFGGDGATLSRRREAATTRGRVAFDSLICLEH